ncbi:MAG: hypothetical protein M1817_004621 [Caeruleum heppii]|nr:MAG: hypothetical protein M1817_004621 [Caeruleum heppii]
MNHQPRSMEHHPLPTTATSHPDNPVPEEPPSPAYDISPTASSESLHSDTLPPTVFDPADSDGVSTPRTDPDTGSASDTAKAAGGEELLNKPRRRRASTKLISQNEDDKRRLIGQGKGATVELVEKVCCGGGCCFLESLEPTSDTSEPILQPDNDAYRSLNLKLGPLSKHSKLTGTVPLPPQTISFGLIESSEKATVSRANHPPSFVTPHPPYNVFSSPLHHARELTKPGAEKRTYHFDLDVTDYPQEGGVDFVVGGAVGICAPNPPDCVDDLFDLLGVPRHVRDKPVLLKTDTGRWPTIWGDEKSRELPTTRRDLLTWCSDLQSYPPTKILLRLLAEYATEEHEKMILLFLSSAQGQAAFCDLRTGSHLTVNQLLHAFPSSQPPLPHLLSVLPQLMPRFYSLSNDPHISCLRSNETNCRRLIEIAVSVHETPDWRGGNRTGVGSGFFERSARQLIEAEQAGISSQDLDLRIPMFRGLMSNPLAREFVSDGPMLLIGAGVGVAPFRGFVQRRLKSANCANKVWVLQGVRDSLLDELYSGEWGVHEDKLKKVVQSRQGQGKYVQEEVRHQADLVWFIINALDGRVFVCGSSKGMGEGVESALVDVAMDKGRLNQQEAEAFWAQKKEGGQYIAVSFPSFHVIDIENIY